MGITLGERMGNMTSEERRDWINRTIIAGMRDADRKVKLLYRAPLSAGLSSEGSTSKTTELITRELLDTLTASEDLLISFKYNWSHGHTADKLFIVHGGKLTDTYWNPLPDNYKVLWTVRNEDFFILRWGQPDFVRSFIQNNKKEYVTGCILGSECYIPANDYISIDYKGKNQNYAFERQWLFYLIWGRLLYHPEMNDSVFIHEIESKFNIRHGEEFLRAFKLASNFYHRFGSFYKGTWDATAYAEAFIGFDKVTAKHITLDMLIRNKVLDTINYMDIEEFIKTDRNLKTNSKITPLQLADTCEKEADELMKMADLFFTEYPENQPIFN
ncbi:MAG: hypothetical protein HC906_00780 [Bacteroidales bacterium]|nr:hypothetical protein [Bacteroidales bacterium]